jgi:flavodoxin I
MLILAEKVVERGAVLVGATPVDGYSFDNSRAIRDGKLVGLAINEDSQSDKTAGRIREWAAELKREFA